MHVAMASIEPSHDGDEDFVRLIAAKGLAPAAQYRVYLAESNRPPFGTLQPLALLKTNPDGAGIVQAIGPLKQLADTGSNPAIAARQRFLIVADLKDTAQVLLRQTTTAKNH